MNVTGFHIVDPVEFEPVALVVEISDQNQQDAIVNAYADMDRLYNHLYVVLGEEEADILADLIENMAVTLLQLDGSIMDDEGSSDEIETDSEKVL